MTQALNLRTSKVITLLVFLALLFSLIYLIFLPRTFAQTTTVKEARKDLRLAKLDERKLKVCQTHEKNITKRLESLTNLVTNQEEKFASIAARVENHYLTKSVPAGKTVSNYDALVADIAAKKTAVDNALATAKTNASNFSCTGDDPKGLLTTFRKDMQAVKSALHDYRKSIRNLIVAVRGEKTSPTPSPTPKP